ncbi:olfactory receptor 5V1-like [Ambystoma mexicanum]|uniref:olfactory receptor 5V1-like n=1 Tax=Ambystoma mexicanum TaxID=8296 RepID=UPI0037E91BD7
MKNQSSVTGFRLEGLPSSPHWLLMSFTVFLTLYLMTLIGNVLIVTAVSVDPGLHTAMYFFLSNLSFLEVLYTSVTVPNILLNIACKRNHISFNGCMAQAYLFTGCATTECVLLAVMAYDRYVAICHPLHYRAIMNRRVCVQLAGATWLAGILNSVVQTLPTSLLPYCRDNALDRLYCEVQPLLKLSCSDTYVNKVLTSASASLFGVGLLIFILMSYIYIVLTILRIPSTAGRLKAFSTCASHVTVVVLYYGALIFMYLRPISDDSRKVDSVMSAVYCIVIPVLNPMIYSLRNKDVKGALRTTLHRKISALRHMQP